MQVTLISRLHIVMILQKKDSLCAREGSFRILIPYQARDLGSMRYRTTSRKDKTAIGVLHFVL